MAKNFPYFKFTATEWLTGNIALEDYELQGLFINICALYWQRDGKLTKTDLLKRYKTDRFYSLFDNYLTEKDGFISIDFLDEQLAEVHHISQVNSENGKKGGRPKTLVNTEEKTDRLTTANRPPSEKKQIRKEEEEEKNKKRIREVFTPPEFLDVENYFFDNYDGLDAKQQAERFFNHFTANGWKIGGRAPMKDWKAAARNWMSRSAEFKPKGQQPSKIETNLTALHQSLEFLNQQDRNNGTH